MANVDDNVENNAPAAGEEVNTAEKKEEPPRKFTFPAHQSHMVSLAKMCQENTEFTDCVIQCGDGAALKAHRYFSL